MSHAPSVMILAGEVSGDLHAARLVRALTARQPNLEVFGTGGDAMREAGVETLYDIDRLAVTGLTEILRSYSYLRRVFFDLLATARERKPDAVILVDYPGFNLRFARYAHRAGLKTLYYICPQVWAWNRGRIPRMARILDHLICFFPFEKQYFAATDLSVDFVGHPLVDEIADFRRHDKPPLPWHGTPHIALLPGSRRNEIERNLPNMWQAARLIENRHPGASFLVPTPGPSVTALVERTLAGLPAGPTRFACVEGRARQVMHEARAGIVVSGTATLEAALLGCPMIITYQASPLTYAIGRRLVKVKYLGLVNLLADREICPELLQDRGSPQALADAIEPLLSSEAAHASMVEDLHTVAASLGGEGATDRAAESVLNAL